MTERELSAVETRENLRAGSAGSSAPGEERRNRLLRRVDWRFLSSDPVPEKAICFESGVLLEALREVAKTVVEPSPDRSDRDCDLAVAVDPDAATLARAGDALGSGGAIYCEWTRWRSRGQKRIGRALKAAGFEDVELFWPDADPAVANPAAWLPLGSSRVLRYHFVENRGRSRTALKRAVRGFLRRGLALAPRARLARPVCSLASKASRPSRATGDRLRPFLLERWESWGLGKRPKSISSLLLTGGLRSESKVILLAFAHGESRPRIALKIPRTSRSVPAVEREGEILQALHARTGQTLPPGIPRPLFCGRVANATMLVETAFTGSPLLSAWTRSNYGELSRRAARWLAELAHSRPTAAPAAWRPRLVDAVFDQFARSFGSAVEPSFLRDLEASLSLLPPLPLVCEQRDFSPWNVLLTPEGELAVVDWESAELDGLPALDLLYFLVNAGFSLDGARRTGNYRESYRQTLDPSSERGSVAAECLSEYCDLVKIDASCLPALRLLAWLIHSRSEFAQLSQDAGGPPDSATLRRSVFLGLCDEELRHRV